MSIVIIYPTKLLTYNSQQLIGKVQFSDNCVFFYVLNQVGSGCKEELTSIGFCKNLENNTISNVNKKPQRTRIQRSRNTVCGQTHPNWIDLEVSENHIDINRLYINDREFNVRSTDITFVQYNEKLFLKSKLLNYKLEDEMSTTDCFQSLRRYVVGSHREDSENSDEEKTGHIGVIQQSLEKTLNVCRWFKIFTFSSMYNHFICLLESSIWCLKSFQARRHKLKLLNLFTCVVLDILVGGYLLSCFHQTVNTRDEMFTLVSNKCESIVSSLHHLVVWLQGNPAGLKLNHPLTFLLGKFYIYHIQLWWSFLVLCRPLLELMYDVFLLIGYFGFTFQLCIISDLLTLASFHVYCIYVYAARLYNIQLQSLLILTRVFIGKKRNPEPGKVDSVPYTTEQLFIGTIAFTVLLFLLPTTLVYYVVFTLIRLVIISVEGCLNRIKSTFQTLPIYVTFLYLLKSPQTTSTIKLSPELDRGSGGRVHMLATPVHQSLLKTLKMTIPDPLNKSNPVDWGQLGTSVLTGKLIYPM